MSRVQLALNVDNLDEAIAFYSKLFDAKPAKVKPGYANFAIAQPPLKLVLLENPGHGGTLNHLGVEVESSEAVHFDAEMVKGAAVAWVLEQHQFQWGLGDREVGVAGFDLGRLSVEQLGVEGDCLVEVVDVEGQLHA